MCLVPTVVHGEQVPYLPQPGVYGVRVYSVEIFKLHQLMISRGPRSGLGYEAGRESMLVHPWGLQMFCV